MTEICWIFQDPLLFVPIISCITGYQVRHRVIRVCYQENYDSRPIPPTVQDFKR
jgi:hypothetical protein